MSAGALSPSEVATFVSAFAPLLKKDGDGWKGDCWDPEHPGDGNSGSMNVEPDGRWYCHSGQHGGNLFKLGVDAAEVYRLAGRAPLPKKGEQKIVATYSYLGENGEELFQKVRLDPKDFRQRHSVDGKWIWKLEGVQQVPYHLPDLLTADSAQPIFVVEGEKGVNKLREIGVIATCSPSGKMNWNKIQDDLLSKIFRGRHVVISTDEDDKEQKGARDLVRRLNGVCASARILELPDLPPKGDAFDWIEAGGTKAQLLTLARKVPELRELPTTAEAPTKTEHWSPEGIIGVPLSQRHIPEREYLVEGLIPKQGVVLISALPGHGKSILCYALGQAVSRGEDFAGINTRQCPVLYIDRENDGSYWKSEVMGKLFEQEEGTNFSFNLGSDVNTPPELNDPGLIAWIKSCEPKPLIIVDSLSKYMVGQNENQAQDVDPWMVQAIALRNMSATVLIIHHMGKTGTSRGSTAIVANVDWALDLIRDEGVIPCGPDQGKMGLGTVEVTVSKGRGAHAELILFKFNYELHRFELMKMGSGTSSHASNFDEKLINLLRVNTRDGLSERQLVTMAAIKDPGNANDVEVPKRAVESFVKRFLDKIPGISRTGKGKFTKLQWQEVGMSQMPLTAGSRHDLDSVNC